MTCHVDAKIDEIYPNCCIDYGKPEDCTIAKSLTCKEQCIHWHDDNFPIGFLDWWNSTYGEEYHHRGIALAAWKAAMKVGVDTMATKGD